MMHRLETLRDPRPERLPPSHGCGAAVYGLTLQEQQVLALLIQGHHRKTAADAMGISINTVSFHLKNLYAKLGVHSKTEAVIRALMEGVPVGPVGRGGCALELPRRA